MIFKTALGIFTRNTNFVPITSFLIDCLTPLLSLSLILTSLTAEPPSRASVAPNPSHSAIILPRLIKARCCNWDIVNLFTFLRQDCINTTPASHGPSPPLSESQVQPRPREGNPWPRNQTLWYPSSIYKAWYLLKVTMGTFMLIQRRLSSIETTHLTQVLETLWSLVSVPGQGLQCPSVCHAPPPPWARVCLSSHLSGLSMGQALLTARHTCP